MCGVIKDTAHVSLMDMCNIDKYLMETTVLRSQLWKTLEDVLEDVLGDNALTMQKYHIRECIGLQAIYGQGWKTFWKMLHFR